MFLPVIISRTSEFDEVSPWIYSTHVVGSFIIKRYEPLLVNEKMFHHFDHYQTTYIPQRVIHIIAQWVEHLLDKQRIRVRVEEKNLSSFSSDLEMSKSSVYSDREEIQNPEPRVDNDNWNHNCVTFCSRRHKEKMYIYICQIIFRIHYGITER